MSFVYKAGLLLSDLGLVAMIAQVPVAVEDIVKAGDSIGKLTAASILGIVSIVCVLGLLLQYRDQKQHIDKLYKLIEENTKAHQTSASALENVTSVMVEVKDVIIKCKGHE